ncbi:hypothetical protein GUJ93_ZPchr0009g1197 [Zizania palustris]|uniref:Ubiquitin-like domain-containing protein n=1 Tax=Zizania palustris TaxID=103762 RepID=A0A8J5RGE5_ZIZPA|nr:hypothetical protein GUJ93_ZPchr0009g1197 [Zizania palustris]
MDVTFETARGRRFTVEIWFMSTVKRIKEYVMRQEGIPVESQRIFFDGKELKDDLDTEHYSILQGSCLRLVLPGDGDAPGIGRMVRVIVVSPALVPGGVTLDVDAAFNVARFKELLQEKTDGALPAARMVLLFGKLEMEDDKTVGEYGPPGPDGIQVTAVVQPKQPAPAAAISKKKQPLVTVQVKWGNMAVGLEVSDLLAVKELRAELGAGAAAKLPLPKDGGYFFIYKQNVMEEDHTLRWHDVKNGDTIEIFNGQVTGGA